MGLWILGITALIIIALPFIYPKEEVLDQRTEELNRKRGDARWKASMKFAEPWQVHKQI